MFVSNFTLPVCFLWGVCVYLFVQVYKYCHLRFASTTITTNGDCKHFGWAVCSLGALWFGWNMIYIYICMCPHITFLFYVDNTVHIGFNEYVWCQFAIHSPVQMSGSSKKKKVGILVILIHNPGWCASSATVPVRIVITYCLVLREFASLLECGTGLQFYTHLSRTSDKQ